MDCQLSMRRENRSGRNGRWTLVSKSVYPFVGLREPCRTGPRPGQTSVCGGGVVGSIVQSEITLGPVQ